MTKCLECGSEIKQTEGRRPRKFCDNKGKCKGAYWLKNKPKEPRYVLKSTLDSVVAKYEGLLSVIPKGNRVDINPLIDAARGRDASGINEDELNIPQKQQIASQIEKYEAEISILQNGPIANRIRKTLEGKIRELKNNI